MSLTILFMLVANDIFEERFIAIFIVDVGNATQGTYIATTERTEVTVINILVAIKATAFGLLG